MVFEISGKHLTGNFIPPYHEPDIFLIFVYREITTITERFGIGRKILLF